MIEIDKESKNIKTGFQTVCGRWSPRRDWLVVGGGGGGESILRFYSYDGFILFNLLVSSPTLYSMSIDSLGLRLCVVVDGNLYFACLKSLIVFACNRETCTVASTLGLNVVELQSGRCRVDESLSRVVAVGANQNVFVVVEEVESGRENTGRVDDG